MNYVLPFYTKTVDNFFIQRLNFLLREINGLFYFVLFCFVLFYYFVFVLIKDLVGKGNSAALTRTYRLGLK